MSCVSITLLEKQGLLLDSSLTINHNNPGGTGRLFADVAADASRLIELLPPAMQCAFAARPFLSDHFRHEFFPITDRRCLSWDDVSFSPPFVVFVHLEVCRDVRPSSPR